MLAMRRSSNILDQVRALEKEILKRFDEQGIDAHVQILVITRLIPEAQVESQRSGRAHLVLLVSRSWNLASQRA